MCFVRRILWSWPSFPMLAPFHILFTIANTILLSLSTTTLPSFHLRRLRLLRPILTPTRNPIRHPSQITRAPHTMIPDSGTILRPPPPNHHNTMLLHIMSLSRNIRRHHPSTAQSHTTCFALPRVWLLGPRDAHFEADAAHAGAVDERR